MFSFLSLITSAEDNNCVFVGNPPEAISGDLYLNIRNLSTKETQIIYLRDYNKYQLFTYLPEGDYKIIEGGKINDYNGDYIPDFKTFTINGDNTIVQVDFGNKVVTTKSITTKKQIILEDKTQKEINGVADYSGIIMLVVFCVIVIIIFIFIKWVRKKTKYGGLN